MSRDLTDREIKIILLVLLGASNAEIARIFGVSEGTIKNSISIIFDKLGMKSRNELILKYKDKF